jgi:hypothetical protein
LHQNFLTLLLILVILFHIVIFLYLLIEDREMNYELQHSLYAYYVLLQHDEDSKYFYLKDNMKVFVQ